MDNFVLTPDVSDMESMTIDNIQRLKDKQVNSRTWFERTFSQINKGSLRGGIFNLIQASVGSGCLSLPYVYRQSGFVMGIVLTLFCGIVSLLSMRMLVIASQLQNTSRYSALMRASFGKVHLFIFISIYLSES